MCSVAGLLQCVEIAPYWTAKSNVKPEPIARDREQVL